MAQNWSRGEDEINFSIETGDIIILKDNAKLKFP